MKRILASALLAVLISGCLEVKVTTTVRSDGSSERTVRVVRDEQKLPDAAFPIPADTSWTVAWTQLDGKEKKFEYVARKSFTTPEALAAEYTGRPDTAVFGLAVSLHRRFEWFYTYLDYREVYSIRNPLRALPLENYMTPAEIERVRGGLAKGDTLGKKVGRWVERSAFEEFIVDLITAAKRRGMNDLSAALSGRRGELAAVVDEKEIHGVEDVLARMSTMLAAPAVMDLLPEAEDSWRRIEPKMARLQTADGTYKNSVSMPGLLLETNSGSVEGSTASWEVDSQRLLVGEYVMTATSRVANVWAFVVTALAGLGLLALVLVRGLRRTAPAA